jgi:hypothetical protein
MAMTNRIEAGQASLKRRIRQFYGLLNRGAFERCRRMIDPRVRLRPSSVTLHQYENALRQFLDQFGSIEVLEIEVRLHLDEPSELYEGRDFAVGKTTWEDRAGKRRVFAERWVREGRSWYTRSTGLLAPAVLVPQVRVGESSAIPQRAE